MKYSITIDSIGFLVLNAMPNVTNEHENTFFGTIFFGSSS